MPSPLISVVIPVCNGANYLRQAVDSALAAVVSAPLRAYPALYRENVASLYERCIALQSEKDRREKLFFWKLPAPCLRMEDRVRRLVKRRLGR
jgi:hypothetical protein